MSENDGTVLMEDVDIIFRNFAGAEGQYNREGDRNFGVKIPDQAVADQMMADGWNIKLLKPREEDEDDAPYVPWLSVSVKYGRGRPPRVVVVTSRGRTNLDEDSIEMLDWADIKMVDLIVRPYHWNVSGKTGTKAYLKSIFVTIEEDALDLKYAELDGQ